MSNTTASPVIVEKNIEGKIQIEKIDIEKIEELSQYGIDLISYFSEKIKKEVENVREKDIKIANLIKTKEDLEEKLNGLNINNKLLKEELDKTKKLSSEEVENTIEKNKNLEMQIEDLKEKNQKIENENKDLKEKNENLKTEYNKILEERENSNINDDKVSQKRMLEEINAELFERLSKEMKHIFLESKTVKKSESQVMDKS
ncbi:MAG: hypothetical protein ACRC0F_10525 [Cetobacterium sp.]